MEKSKGQEIHRSHSKKLGDNSVIDKSLESGACDFWPKISKQERKLTWKITDIDLQDNTFEDRVLDLKFKAIEQERKVITRKISDEQQRIVAEHSQRLHRTKVENNKRLQASVGVRRAGTPFVSANLSRNTNRHVPLSRITSSNLHRKSPNTEPQSERVHFDRDEESEELIPLKRERSRSLFESDLAESVKVDTEDTQCENLISTPHFMEPRRSKTIITGLFGETNKASKAVYLGDSHPLSPSKETPRTKYIRGRKQNTISVDTEQVKKSEADELFQSIHQKEIPNDKQGPDVVQSQVRPLDIRGRSLSLPFLPNIHPPFSRRRYNSTNDDSGRNNDERLRSESRRTTENIADKSINDLNQNWENLTTPELVSRPKGKNLEAIHLTSANKSPNVKDLWKRAYDFARMDSFKSRFYGEGKPEQFVDGHEPVAEKNARECLQDHRLLRLVEILTSKKNASDLNLEKSK